MSLEPEKHIGKIVEVTFLDHMWGDTVEMPWCVIWGRLIEDDWQKIVVQVWETDKSETINAEYATLIRSAVVSIRPLTYEEN